MQGAAWPICTISVPASVGFFRLERVSLSELFAEHLPVPAVALPVLVWCDYCRRYHNVVQRHLCIRSVSSAAYVRGEKRWLVDTRAKFSKPVVVVVALVRGKAVFEQMWHDEHPR